MVIGSLASAAADGPLHGNYWYIRNMYKTCKKYSVLSTNRRPPVIRLGKRVERLISLTPHYNAVAVKWRGVSERERELNVHNSTAGFTTT